MSHASFIVEYARTGRAGCKEKHCLHSRIIEKDALRIGRLQPFELYEAGGVQTEWYHPDCIFTKLKRARKASKHIESETDIDGFGALRPEDQDTIRALILAAHDPSAKTVKSPSKPKPMAAPAVEEKAVAEKRPLEDISEGSFFAKLTHESGKVALFPPGKHFIGRDNLFGILDKKCSRKQVEMSVDGESEIITITPLGVNPCCLERNGVTIVMSKNVSYSLADGDRFSLVVGKHYFTVTKTHQEESVAKVAKTEVGAPEEKIETPVEEETNSPVTTTITTTTAAAADTTVPAEDGDTRPFCKYGAACYRKNQQHRNDFRH
eukprot:TRINITY_DN492_c0_g1_i1.p1 TRINITY_DN492_c0_g1~~TRINITY_DN492_c0_g1_i1.p1  ORF type:complete len:321 (+),score=89.54 TRINITY_DN492_c0_g1_i1:1-963(+)